MSRLLALAVLWTPLVLTADTAAALINEAALKQFGFKEPLGEWVKANGRTYQIIKLFYREKEILEAFKGFREIEYGVTGNYFWYLRCKN